VSVWFQELFHSPSGVLFTFPSRYWFTIGHGLVFSLTRWSSQIPTGFHVSRRTRESSRSIGFFAYRAFTFYGRAFQQRSTNPADTTLRSHNPEWTYPLGLGCSPFARRYLGNRYLLSIPSGT